VSDIKLFKIKNGSVNELQSSSAKIEKSLQTQMESHLDVYLGVRFLASEYSTGNNHGGRIDTLGIDENYCPVIIEYKRSVNENVINQGLFYLDWLMDHKAEFELLVLKNLSQGDSENIDWSNPRLLCIASDFTKYDLHAVNQMNRNIELIRYHRFGKDLLLLDLINVVEAKTTTNGSTGVVSNNQYKRVTDYLESADSKLTDLYHSVRDYLLNLGDDVQEKTLKNYFAFKRIKNFACVEVHPQSHKLLVYLKLNPSKVEMEKGFSRDVRKIGHFGTGDLEVTIKNEKDFEKAQALMLESYEKS